MLSFVLLAWVAMAAVFTRASVLVLCKDIISFISACACPLRRKLPYSVSICSMILALKEHFLPLVKALQEIMSVKLLAWLLLLWLQVGHRTARTRGGKDVPTGLRSVLQKTTAGPYSYLHVYSMNHRQI